MKTKSFKGKSSNNTNIVYYAFFLATIILVATIISMYFYGNMWGMTEKFGIEGKYNIEYYYMESCPHCVEFSPIWNELISNTKYEKITFVKYEIAENRDRSNKFNINSAPTIIVVDKKNDMMVASYTEKRTAPELMKFFDKYNV